MRRTTMVIALILCGSQVWTADEEAGDAKAGAEKSASCVACHNAMVNLAGRGQKALREQIDAIRAGERKHPPGLEALADDDLTDIAAFLDAAK